MVVPMVIIMSFYGAMEAVISRGAGWDQLLLIWIFNIPRNFIMALPLQLLVAGPVIRGLFRDCFRKELCWLKRILVFPGYGCVCHP